MEKKRDKMWRRSCTASITKPFMTTSLRSILDRTSQGLPINSRIAKHEPLPPDGENLDDFETGTEEYLDHVDVQHLAEDIEKAKQKIDEERKQKVDEARKKAFNEAVEAEIAKRSATSNEA